MNVLSDITGRVGRGEKLFALLIDPEEHTPATVERLLRRIGSRPADLVLLGGSLVTRPVEPVAKVLRAALEVPLVLFPGSLLQLTGEADALLMLTLLSGRNPQYLAGDQVTAAPYIRNLGMEVIPTAYLLVGDGRASAVEVVSGTAPLPEQRSEVITATALAAEYMGSRLIYLEKGSGAPQPLDTEVVRKVRSLITVPLIAGGGITHPREAAILYQAGADIIVVGNALEKDPALAEGFKEAADRAGKEKN